ncbi:MAG: ABC transporter permease [Solirubrobacteraceae bacterium]
MSTTAVTETPPVAAGPGRRGPAGFARTLHSGWAQLPLKAKIGVVILGAFLIVAIIGPYVAPFSPNHVTPSQYQAEGLTSTHLLGSDNLGQDILSQMLVGTRSTVLIGLLTGLIATTLSVTVGTAAGYLGGWSDEGLSLVSNVFLVLPALPLLVVILGFFPNAGNLLIAIVLSVLGWPWGARVIRAQTLALSNRDFVLAAREVGERSSRIIFYELLPNEVGLIAASFVGTVLYAILTSVALAFIGLTNPTAWSYGTILDNAFTENAVQTGAWWWFIFPGVAVALLGMSLVLINFGLDELSNPRLRAARGLSRIGRRAWRPADPTPVLLGYVEETA